MRRLILNSLISIIISTYNQENFIEEAIQSVLQQKYENFEVILVNASSKEQTKEIVEKYRSDKFHIYEKKNCGLSETRNFGASKSSGKYILFLDGDDKIHPEFLSKTHSLLEDNPLIGFAYVDTQHFGESNGHWDHPEYNFKMLLSTNYISSCSLIRKKSFDEAKGFDKNNWGYWEDWQFWIKMGSLGWNGKHIAEKLFYYRVHSKSGMQSDRNKALAMVYKTYIVLQFPQYYDKDFVNSCKNIMSLYPKDFMAWSFEAQEGWLNE